MSAWNARSGAAAPESGYTLIETMIAMTLLSVVMAAAFGVVSVMQRGAMTTTNRFTAEGEAQTIADRISKDIRAAVAASATGAAFASADVNDVTFYASLADPNGPTKLHAYLTLLGGTNVYLFHEDSTPPDAGGSPGNYTYSGAGVDAHRRQVPRHDAADLLLLRRRREHDHHADHDHREPAQHQQRRHQRAGAGDADGADRRDQQRRPRSQRRLQPQQLSR